jgi:hypothetical protein
MLRLLRLRLRGIALDASRYPGGPWLNRAGPARHILGHKTPILTTRI